jgi:hypothetical protein
VATTGRRRRPPRAVRSGNRAPTLHARAGRRPHAVPPPLPARPAASPRRASAPGVEAGEACHGRPCSFARVLRTTDRVASRATDRAENRPRGDAGARGSAPAADNRRPGPVCPGRASLPWTPRPPRRCSRSDLQGARPRAAPRGADGGRRRTARARARSRPLVGRRRLPGGTRAAGTGARRRPRARQALCRALGTLGRGLGDGRAARALRRMAGPRQRLPDGGVWAGPPARHHRLRAWRSTEGAWPFSGRGRSASR